MNRLTRLVAVTATGLALAGCGTGHPSAPGASGRYPIATPPASVTAMPRVAAGGYQLVAAGDTVVVDLPDATLRVVAEGPDVTTRSLPDGRIDHSSADGTITVRFAVDRGTITVPASSLLLLDEKQAPVAARRAPLSVTVRAGSASTITLAATFQAGHTTVTWRPVDDKPLVTWDFTVELD